MTADYETRVAIKMAEKSLESNKTRLSLFFEELKIRAHEGFKTLEFRISNNPEKARAVAQEKSLTYNRLLDEWLALKGSVRGEHEKRHEIHTFLTNLEKKYPKSREEIEKIREDAKTLEQQIENIRSITDTTGATVEQFMDRIHNSFRYMVQTYMSKPETAEDLDKLAKKLSTLLNEWDNVQVSVKREAEKRAEILKYLETPLREYPDKNILDFVNSLRGLVSTYMTQNQREITDTKEASVTQFMERMKTKIQTIQLGLENTEKEEKVKSDFANSLFHNLESWATNKGDLEGEYRAREEFFSIIDGMIRTLPTAAADLKKLREDFELFMAQNLGNILSIKGEGNPVQFVSRMELKLTDFIRSSNSPEEATSLEALKPRLWRDLLPAEKKLAEAKDRDLRKEAGLEVSKFFRKIRKGQYPSEFIYSFDYDEATFRLSFFPERHTTR